MTRLLGTLVALLVGLLVATGLAAVPAQAGPADARLAQPHAAERKAPTREQWLADVRTAMTGSARAVRDRVAERGEDERLAVNFDIDNTVLATYYDGGGAIPRMLRFVRLLERNDVAVLFNTGRVASMRRTTLAQLRRNGFPVDGLCLRAKGARLAPGKQRCRDRFIDEGYTLIANVGNNDTDFTGDGYERAYVLPNYGGLLG